MNFYKNLFVKKKEEKKEEENLEVKPEVKEEAPAMGCDCTGCPSSGGGCPGEEMKKAVAEEEEK